ncbi:MAG: GTPase [Candidatus Micrarchaeota archaeon]
MPNKILDNYRRVFEFLQWCDIAIEVVDARNVEGTRSSKMDKRIKDKLLIAACKADLLPSDARRIKETEGIPIIYFSTRTRVGIPNLLRHIRLMRTKKKVERIKVTIFGIPNVGKSTLINVLSRRHAARTGFMPGITRGEQWVKIGDDILLCDTPGVFVLNNTESELAEKGAVAVEKLKNPMAAATKLIDKFSCCHNNSLFKFYGVEKAKGDEALEAITRKRCMLLRRGEPNLEEMAKVIMRDFQKGKFVLVKK